MHVGQIVSYLGNTTNMSDENIIISVVLAML